MPEFVVVDCDQRSPEWLAARLGRLTGSRAADFLAQTKSGPSASRKNYRTQLVLERVTGRLGEGFTSAAMQTGIEREPIARELYELASGNSVYQTGFLRCEDIMAGCSLDGHVGEYEGIVEIKCPQPATHLSYLTSGKVPDNYAKQILHNLWVSGAAWADFVSFNPDFPEKLQLKIVRVERDDQAVIEYETAALEFLSEVELEQRLLERMAA